MKVPCPVCGGGSIGNEPNATCVRCRSRGTVIIECPDCGERSARDGQWWRYGWICEECMKNKEEERDE